MPEHLTSLTKPHWPQQLVNALDTFTCTLGKTVAWLTLLMVIATGIVVVLRRGFDIGSIGLQESVTYMHAAVFLLGAAYALQQGDQVRVDILYAKFSRHGKAWVDSLGALILLLPVSAFIGFISWDFVVNSWQIREASTDSGGVGMVYLLKGLIPLAAVTLSVQALAEILRNLLILMGIGNKEANSAADTATAEEADA
jgi:TRAP-type mannitol/chloroaromatic compound transport system permease small subunit